MSLLLAFRIKRWKPNMSLFAFQFALQLQTIAKSAPKTAASSIVKMKDFFLKFYFIGRSVTLFVFPLERLFACEAKCRNLL